MPAVRKKFDMKKRLLPLLLCLVLTLTACGPKDPVPDAENASSVAASSPQQESEHPAVNPEMAALGVTQENYPRIHGSTSTVEMARAIHQAVYGHGGTAQPTETYALGYTLFTYLRDMNEVTGIGEQLKVLDYEGVAATVENISTGTYALTDGYYAVT